ncbi:MAG: hypothetical protein AB8B85_03205 [Paracoccaceae bacterium]
MSFFPSLTESPSAVVQTDVDALLPAGWSEDGIHDIISVMSIYAFINRLLEGSGMKEDMVPAGFTATKARAGRYSDMLATIKGR